MYIGEQRFVEKFIFEAMSIFVDYEEELKKMRAIKAQKHIQIKKDEEFVDEDDKDSDYGEKLSDDEDVRDQKKRKTMMKKNQ